MILIHTIHTHTDIINIHRDREREREREREEIHRKEYTVPEGLTVEVDDLEVLIFCCLTAKAAIEAATRRPNLTIMKVLLIGKS